jgi:four helix bundle protein
VGLFFGFSVEKRFSDSVYEDGFRFSVEMQTTKPKSRSYCDLDVWKLSIELAKGLYSLSSKLPPSENYGLTNQIRRAAVSIPSNIVEGQGRNSAKEFRQFLAIGLGSVAELETQLILTKEIGYLTSEEVRPFLSTLDRVRKMIKALSKGIAGS